MRASEAEVIVNRVKYGKVPQGTGKILVMDDDKNVNAIVVSGYSSDSVMNNCREYGFKDCIKKPYTLEQLANVIYRVINKTK